MTLWRTVRWPFSAFVAVPLTVGSMFVLDEIYWRLNEASWPLGLAYPVGGLLYVALTLTVGFSAARLPGWIRSAVRLVAERSRPEIAATLSILGVSTIATAFAVSSDRTYGLLINVGVSLLFGAGIEFLLEVHAEQHDREDEGLHESDS